MHNGLDLLDNFKLTVREDASHFNGAVASIVRDDFEKWATSAVLEENDRTGPVNVMARSPRYNFCLFIDEEAMRSVVDLAPPLEELDTTNQGWVKLILRDFKEVLEAQSRPLDPVLDGDFVEELFEPLEGCIYEDVGWMKIPYQFVMTSTYLRLVDWNAWHTIYCRPPEIAEL